MKFRDLKVSIASDFAVLLCVGMLLVNFVLLSIWRHHMAGYVVEEGRANLSFLAANSQNRCEDMIATINLYNTTLEQTNQYVVPFLSGRIVTSDNNALDDWITKNLALSAYTETERVQTRGNAQSIFGFGVKEILLTQPLDKCTGPSSIGVIIKLEDIHEEILAKQPYVLVYILVNLIVLTTLGFFRLRKSVVKPLEKLIKISDTYTGSSNELLDLRSDRSEFGHVASSLHSMLSRIEKDKDKLNSTISSLEEANKQLVENQKTLVEAEKFAAVGRLSAGFAHEIGNPIGIIQGYVELLGRGDVSVEEREQYKNRAVKELDRVTQLIHQLLNLARKKDDLKHRTDVTALLAELVDVMQQQKTSRHIHIRNICGADIHRVQCSETTLYQVVLNCLLNCIDAINEKNMDDGEIHISVSNSRKAGGTFVLIEIEDNGCGIEQKNLSEVFDPFFTTKDVGEGTGLGLSVSRSMLENIGGSISLYSKIGVGTKITITLPAIEVEEDKQETEGN